MRFCRRDYRVVSVGAAEISVLHPDALFVYDRVSCVVSTEDLFLAPRRENYCAIAFVIFLGLVIGSDIL